MRGMDEDQFNSDTKLIKWSSSEQYFDGAFLVLDILYHCVL